MCVALWVPAALAAEAVTPTAGSVGVPATKAPVATPAPVAASVPVATPAPGGASAPAPVAAATFELPPLPPATVQALSGIVEDPAPPALVRDQHYVISNESRHDLFRTAVKDRGGVYIGVGSDQNYLIAGWARPELMVLFDFDQVVVNLHRVYRAFFLNARTAEEFLELWEVKNERRAEALLVSEYPDAAKRALVVRAYRTGRYAVPKRMRAVLETYKQHKVASFLNDPAQYQYLAAMFRSGRVVMVRGDLTAGVCMTSIAKAIQTSGGTVRLLYLSNAERYFPYSEPFRKSMLALPTDEKSLVLRTRARRDGSYEYLLQEASNFAAWVSRRAISISFQYTHLREPVKDPVTNQAQDPDLFVINRLPAPPAPTNKPKSGPATPPATRVGAATVPAAPPDRGGSPTPPTGLGI